MTVSTLLQHETLLKPDHSGTYALRGPKVVDPKDYGVTFDGITNDTAAWAATIAALPVSAAIIPIHGPTLIDGSLGHSYALGFNTSDITLLGIGSAAKFILKEGANCNALRFNTSGTNTNPPRLARVRLANFSVDHRGWTQADPGSGIAGAVVVFAADEVDIDGLRVYDAKSVGLAVEACRQVKFHGKGLVDTVIPGAGANGISCIGTSQLTLSPQTDLDIEGWEIVDAPGDGIYAGGFNTNRVSCRGNKIKCRNLLPNISGSPPAAFTPLAAVPAVWDVATTYASGALVTYTLPTKETLLFTSLANGNVGNTPSLSSASWALGAIRAGTGAAIACEGVITSPGYDTSFNDNQIDGRNAAGQYAQHNGVLLAQTAGTAGISQTAGLVSDNTIRGVASYAIQVGEILMGVVGNVIDDCTNGIFLGSTFNQPLSDLIAASNIVRLGGKGGGTGIKLTMATTSAAYPLREAILTGNIIDGGTRGRVTLTAQMTSATQYTSIGVSPMPAAYPSGQVFVVGNPPQNNNGVAGAIITLSAGCAPGDTTLAVNSVTPASTIAVGTYIKTAIGSLSSGLTSGVAVTTIAVAALLAPIQQGASLTLMSPGINSSYGNAAVTVTADAAVGATSITITSFTPGVAWPSGSALVVAGAIGMVINGQVINVTVSGGAIGNVASDVLQVASSGIAPANVEVNGVWLHDAGGRVLNITASTTRFVMTGGGASSAFGGNTLTGTGLNAPTFRRVLGVNPTGTLSPPSVPTSNGGTGSTNTTFSGAISDVLLYVTANAGATCTVYVGAAGGNPASSLVIPAGATLPVQLEPNQKFSLNYASAPTFLAMIGL